MDKKRALINIFATLSLFFLFLNDHTVYSVFFDSITSIFTILSVFFLGICLLIVRKIYAEVNFYFILFLWSISVLISCLWYGLTRIVYVRFAYWMLVVLFVTTIYIANVDFKKILYNVVRIYVIWSLVNYLLNITFLEYLPITATSSKLLYNWYNINLYGHLFSKSYTHLTIGNLSILRLDRPFGEPGIAQMYFNFGFIYACFFEKKYKKKIFWIFVFTLGIVLSCSLTGYVIYFVLSMIYFLSINKKTYFIVFGTIAIIVFLVMLIDKFGTISYEDRSQDLIFMFNTIIDNFPLGIGLGNTSTLKHNVIESTGEVSIGFYCGLLYPFAQFGIFGFIYYYFMFREISHFYINKYVCMSFGFFLLITLFTEPQADEPFIMIFIIDSVLKLVEKDDNKIEEEIESEENECINNNFLETH